MENRDHEITRRVFGEPALLKGQKPGTNPNAVADLMARKEAEAECLMAPIRKNAALYRRLIPGLARAASAATDDAHFLALAEDQVREACALGPSSFDGRQAMIRRVVTWAQVNTALARRCFPEIADAATSDPNWIEALRNDLVERHARALDRAKPD